MAVSTLATLASIVERIRAAAVPGTLFAEHVPDGVLSHVGLALFEMPKRPRGMRAAGYYNALANFSTADYARGVDSSVLVDPLSFGRDDYAELNRVLFEGNRHVLPTDPVVFQRDYAWGNSIALQNVLFSPIRGSQAFGGSAIREVDFRKDLTDITRLADSDRMAVYANIGFANTAVFTANSDEVAYVYAIEAQSSRNTYWRLRVPSSQSREWIPY